MVDEKSTANADVDGIDNENTVENALDILKDIFENVNSWLHFAEAKNGAIIGVNGLFLFKTVDYIFDILSGNINLAIWIPGVMAVLLFLALLIALGSFLPITNVEKGNTDIDISAKLNTTHDRVLIFYEDISKYKSPLQYLRDIYKYYLERDTAIEDLKKIELDYAKEILINSKITVRKYSYFKASLVLNFFAIILFFIFLILA